MRKLLASLCCLALLGCTGCHLFFPGASSDAGASSHAGIDPSAYASRWCYQRLNARLQACYAAIYQAVAESFEKDETVLVKDSQTGEEKTYQGVRVALPRSLLNLDEAKTLYTAFTWDNPQFFYIGNTYGLTGQKNGDKEYFNAISLVYTMSAQERAGAQGRLDRAVEGFLEDIRPGSYQYAKELALHDALAERVTYDTETAESSNPAAHNPNAFTAYGALVEGKAVCEGYSRAMQLLLHQVGIECTLVSGAGVRNPVAHMWNLVTIDGRNYHLDVTWDDSEDRLRHNYFNLTTEEIELSHTIDGDNIGVDTCTATEANYFRHSKTYLDTYSRDDIAQVVALHVRQGKDEIELRFTPETYGNGALFLNNVSLLSQKVDALLENDDLTMWKYIIRREPEEYIVSLYRDEA